MGHSIPCAMTEELAYLLGAYAAEGSTIDSNYSVKICNSYISVLQRLKEIAHTVFGFDGFIEQRPDKCAQLVLASELVNALGTGGMRLTICTPTRRDSCRAD
jgi:hypothetical protein